MFVQKLRHFAALFIALVIFFTLLWVSFWFAIGLTIAFAFVFVLKVITEIRPIRAKSFKQFCAQNLSP